MRLTVSTLLAAALLAGVSAAAAQEVNVYSSRHYPSDDILFGKFTEQTGIKVNLIEGKAEELIERMKREGASSPADVLITVDAGNLWRAEDAGVLQSVDSAVLEEKVPASLQDDENKWFGLAKRARIIVVPADATDYPTTYEGLADSKYQGQLLIRSSSNVYNQSLVGAMMAHHGPEHTEEWARGIVANMARDPQGGDTDQLKALAAGEGTIAVSNSYYLARLATSDNADDRAVAAKLKPVFPNQDDRGTHVNISGAGVAANAPNRDNAVKLLEFLVSPEAQAIFAEANNEYPVVAGVEPASILTQWGPFKEDTLSIATFGQNNPEAVKLMDRAGWK